jgi:multidrug efflux pump subunit AcrA (membrane-fusion protein)
LVGCGQSAVSLPPSTKVAWVEAAPAGADNNIYTNVGRARTERSLGFRAAGKIVERFDDFGQTVQKGLLPMRIDPVHDVLASSDTRANVNAAQARQAGDS